MKNKSVPEVLEKIKLEMRKYSDRVLKVVGVHIDNSFNTETFKQSLEGAIFVPYATNEHVAIADREIRTLKERVRSILVSLPYKRITNMMLDILVVGSIKLKNRLPKHTDLTKTILPAAIVEGKGKLNFIKKRVRFGAYCEVWVKTKNNMEARSMPAIELDRSNDQGAYYFMSILTGQRLHSRWWNEKPVSDEVIAQVEKLADKNVLNEKLMEEL